jgi:molybdopterin converting factor small subunit
MVAVHLWSSLTRFTDGQRVVEVQGDTAGAVLAGLKAAYPALGPVLDGGVSVVIDDAIAPSLHTPVPDGAEVYLMQRLKGG